jgi:hypothetical protein
MLSTCDQRYHRPRALFKCHAALYNFVLEMEGKAIYLKLRSKVMRRHLEYHCPGSRTTATQRIDVERSGANLQGQ